MFLLRKHRFLLRRCTHHVHFNRPTNTVTDLSPQKRPMSPQKRPIYKKRRVNTIRDQFLQRPVYTMTDVYTPSQKRPKSPQKRPLYTITDTMRDLFPQKRPISPQKRPKSPQKRPLYTIKDVHTPSVIYFCRELYTITDTMRDLCPQKRPISPQKRPIYTRDLFLKRLIYTIIDLHTPSVICTSTKENSIHKRDPYLRKRDPYLRKRETKICAKERPKETVVWLHGGND